MALFSSLAHETVGKPIKVVEIGCASAKSFSMLNERFEIDYTGIEIDPAFVQTVRARYAHNPNFRVIQESAENALANLKNADIVVALETFEHIPEHGSANHRSHRRCSAQAFSSALFR
ncbi:MAG: class I SAM-dependent methyltransferase [Comamonadaceae bacterium]|nr:class I SAM-dependent methyltransferase [Comamonadaceae bacterium]